jgi:hypothetical protein
MIRKQNDAPLNFGSVAAQVAPPLHRILISNLHLYFASVGLSQI